MNRHRMEIHLSSKNGSIYALLSGYTHSIRHMVLVVMTSENNINRTLQIGWLKQCQHPT